MPSLANATPSRLSLGLQPLSGLDAPARDNGRFLDPANLTELAQATVVEFDTIHSVLHLETSSAVPCCC